MTQTVEYGHQALDLLWLVKDGLLTVYLKLRAYLESEELHALMKQTLSLSMVMNCCHALLLLSARAVQQVEATRPALKIGDGSRGI
jgi:hypothetical protein